MTPKERVINEILLAQICSYNGKGIWTEFEVEGRNRAEQKGYSEKIVHQLRAIRAINGMPRCSINYWVTESPDQNGYASYIVYFDIKVKEKRYQISFHNPMREAKKYGLAQYAQKGRRTHWVCKSNREACCELARAVKNGELR